MTLYIVSFNGKFLVKAPYWDAGIWTENRDEATRFQDYDAKIFFPKFYPQYAVTPEKERAEPS